MPFYFLTHPHIPIAVGPLPGDVDLSIHGLRQAGRHRAAAARGGGGLCLRSGEYLRTGGQVPWVVAPHGMPWGQEILENLPKSWDIIESWAWNFHILKSWFWLRPKFSWPETLRLINWKTVLLNATFSIPFFWFCFVLCCRSAVGWIWESQVGPCHRRTKYIMHDMSDMRWSFNSDGSEGYEIWIWIRSPVQPRAGVNQRIETKWGSVRARHARKLCKQHYDDSADVEILVESSIASSFEIEQLALPTANNDFLRIVKACHFCHPIVPSIGLRGWHTLSIEGFGCGRNYKYVMSWNLFYLRYHTFYPDPLFGFHIVYKKNHVHAYISHHFPTVFRDEHWF